MYEKGRGYLGTIRDSGSNLSFVKENVPPRVNSSFNTGVNEISGMISGSYNRNSYLDSATGVLV
jgi:hypothetical protein